MKRYIKDIHKQQYFSLTNRYSQRPIRMEAVSARFEKQPPNNLRKSNFFHFVIALYDQNRHPIEIERAAFVDFVEKDKVDFNPNSTVECVPIPSILNPAFVSEMHSSLGERRRCRLLLSYTTRPRPLRSFGGLGHKAIRPSGMKSLDCLFKDLFLFRYFLKFFMKCNQNCLKNAGNPRDMRRFQVAISSTPAIERKLLCISENMFVHNNSKHGRRTRRVDPNEGGNYQPFVCVMDIDFGNPLNVVINLPINEFTHCAVCPTVTPVIKALSPNEGWITGGETVTVIGENFFHGLQVVFGSTAVWGEVRPLLYALLVAINSIFTTVINSFNIEQANLQPLLKVSQKFRLIVIGDSDYKTYLCFSYKIKLIARTCLRCLCYFPCHSAITDPTIEYGFQRLCRIIPRHPGDPERLPREIILKRAADLAEALYTMPARNMALAPSLFPSGPSELVGMDVGREMEASMDRVTSSPKLVCLTRNNLTSTALTGGSMSNFLALSAHSGIAFPYAYDNLDQLGARQQATPSQDDVRLNQASYAFDHKHLEGSVPCAQLLRSLSDSTSVIQDEVVSMSQHSLSSAGGSGLESVQSERAGAVAVTDVRESGVGGREEGGGGSSDSNNDSSTQSSPTHHSMPHKEELFRSGLEEHSGSNKEQHSSEFYTSTRQTAKRPRCDWIDNKRQTLSTEEVVKTCSYVLHLPQTRSYVSGDQLHNNKLQPSGPDVQLNRPQRTTLTGSHAKDTQHTNINQCFAASRSPYKDHTDVDSQGAHVSHGLKHPQPVGESVLLPSEDLDSPLEHHEPRSRNKFTDAPHQSNVVSGVVSPTNNSLSVSYSQMSTSNLEATVGTSATGENWTSSYTVQPLPPSTSSALYSLEEFSKNGILQARKNPFGPDVSVSLPLTTNSELSNVKS
ncbi:early B-cell factor, partial [Paragonimus westermani]